MRIRGGIATVLVALLACTLVQASTASRFLRVGIFDQGQSYYGTSKAYATYKALYVQVLRLNLYWGGSTGVARKRPVHPKDPSDPAYDWTHYDTVVREAAAKGIRVIFSIYGTPAWANGGKGLNVAPSRPTDLQAFAYAAASRYSGYYVDVSGKKVPAVKDWLAWNEPNNPVFLEPQYMRSGGSWVVESAVKYAQICNAVYGGVHGTKLSKEDVACGGTAPRGNNSPRSSRPSVSPLAFLRAVKLNGLKTFDAWAHHPYYAGPADAPAARKGLGIGVDEAVTLGNIGDLIKTVTSLYGNKRIWITEYGYQTDPPDKLFGVTPAKQAAYLKQAVAIARANPRIDMFLWFLLYDEPNLSGWQSGLVTVHGKKKPSFTAFAAAAKPKPAR